MLPLIQVEKRERRPQCAYWSHSSSAELGKLSDSVVQSRLRVAMINLRGSMARQDVSSAAAAIEQLNAMKDLNDEQRVQVGAMRWGTCRRVRVSAWSEVNRWHVSKVLPILVPQAETATD